LWFEVSSCMDTKHKKPLREQKDTWTNIRLNKQHHGTQQKTWHMNMITFPIGRKFICQEQNLVDHFAKFICSVLETVNAKLHCNPKSIPIQIFFVTHLCFVLQILTKWGTKQILTKFWLLTAISQNHRTKFDLFDLEIFKNWEPKVLWFFDLENFKNRNQRLLTKSKNCTTLLKTFTDCILITVHSVRSVSFCRRFCKTRTEGYLILKMFKNLELRYFHSEDSKNWNWKPKTNLTCIYSLKIHGVCVHYLKTQPTTFFNYLL
jgi:hypothetical protein